MSQFRRIAGLPFKYPNTQYEDLRAGESESMLFDPLDTRTPNHHTSTRGEEYRRYVERAKRERKRL